MLYTAVYSIVLVLTYVYDEQLRTSAQVGNKQNVLLVFILYSKAVKKRMRSLHTEIKIPKPGKNLCSTGIMNSQAILNRP